MNAVAVKDKIEKEAACYLEDQVYRALLGYKEPVRSAEIVGALKRETYTARLVRHVLAASPRFAQIDRKWDLEIRYEDKQRPVERVLREIISGCGRPMSVQEIANELSQVYERPADYYESYVAKLLCDEDKFFRTSEGLFGLRQWLLKITSDEEEDVVFDNDLLEEEIAALEKHAGKINWASKVVGTTVTKFLDAVKSPLDNKIVGLFRWRAVGTGFDPVAFFEKLYQNRNLVWLSDGRWATSGMVGKFNKLLTKLADKIEEGVLEAAPAEVVEKAAVEEDMAPVLSLTISDADLDEIVGIIKVEGETRLGTILDRVFEISLRDREYTIAAEGLSDAMRTDPRLVWVGTERWRMADSIPDHVTVVPAKLEIPRLRFETAEGEQIDVELEDQGLEGKLKQEIRNPLVQDVGDEEEITEQDELPTVESARCVLTYHHRQLGTFPLCQIPKTFFPLGPPLVEVTLVKERKHGEVWINRDTGLMYDLKKWYAKDMPESGAVFELLKMERPDECHFVYKDDTDPLVFIAHSRVEELRHLSKEAKESLSTFDIMRRIMPYHKKGVAFVALFTEVNLVRRTTRRMVASILSSYYAFYQRPKSPLWYFDEKKVDQGFKKAKRKYIRKED